MEIELQRDVTLDNLEVRIAIPSFNPNISPTSDKYHFTLGRKLALALADSIQQIYYPRHPAFMILDDGSVKET